MADGTDTNKLSDDIQIAAGQHVGNLSTVSGNVDVGSSAVAGNVNTVSGSVVLRRQARANDLGTVSGNIQLENNAFAAGDVGSVSGSIALGSAAQVKGHLANVSESITLNDAQVDRGIETVSGDITIGAGSRVEGGILVNQPKQGKIHYGTGHTPTIVIGPHAVVLGLLDFRQAVILKVSSSAQIGDVRGAVVEKFSGAAP
jgi:hypothetical protein